MGASVVEVYTFGQLAGISAGLRGTSAEANIGVMSGYRRVAAARRFFQSVVS